MTEAESLITKARRYCIENHSYWSKRYQKKMSGTPYTKNDYNLFPRYNALEAILQGVETIVGKDFNSFVECKKQLKKIGMESHTIFTIDSNEELHLLGKKSKYLSTSDKHNQIERNAIQDERRKFVKFIENQTLDSIKNVKPLPFKRKLLEGESESIREQLLKSWNFDGGYWEPLDKKSKQPTVFLMKDNLEKSDKKEIEKIIKNHIDFENIFLITEELNDYEIGVELLDIDLYESIICNKTFDWVVYGSHESTIAFGGDFLVSKLNQLFENRKGKLNNWDQNY